MGRGTARSAVEGPYGVRTAPPLCFAWSTSPSPAATGRKMSWLRRELQRLAGEEAEGLTGFGDRGFGGFGAEGELLGADEGHVVEAEEAEQDAQMGLLPIEIRGRAV